MKSSKAGLPWFAVALAGAAILASSVAASAAAPPLEVIAVKLRVASQKGTTSGDFQLGAAIPAQVGDQLQVSLVGTGIVNGAGQEVPIEARFNVAAGGRNLQIVRTGPNWALVQVNAASGNSLGQVAFAATGNYHMKPALASGRITFQIGTPAAAPAPAPGPDVPQGYTASRWRQAFSLNLLLYRAILGQDPGLTARADADRIYRNGYGGVLTVASNLARRAEDAGTGRSTLPRGYEERDIERLGGLYRDLLHRQQSNQALMSQDGGFRNNVKALHEKGLPAVVNSIVDSNEFRSVNQIGPM